MLTIEELQNKVSQLEKEVESLKMENQCDVCLGSGKVKTGANSCMCQGTGKMSGSVHYLRGEIYRAYRQLDKYESIIADLRSLMHNYDLGLGKVTPL